MRHSQTLELDLYRKFAWVVSAFLVVLFSGIPWLKGKGWILWPVALASILISLAALRPSWLKQPYHYWMKLGHVFGQINSRILLGAVFYLIVFPLGGLRRLFRRDPLNLSFRKDTPTYRVVRKEPLTAKSAERPY